MFEQVKNIYEESWNKKFIDNRPIKMDNLILHAISKFSNLENKFKKTPLSL